MAINEFKIPDTSKFIPDVSKYTSGFSGSRSHSDLNTSQGLYQTAVNNGLQGQADRLLEKQTGEETKKFFSGGTISDIFDVINAVQYGIVGVVKGKTFKEGIETRQSFSDKDALGKYGLPGVIMGTVLDIALDPFTYLAPYTLLKKVPGIGKGLKAVEAATFGKKVTKTIQGTKKTYEALEGGTKVGKYMASKFAWMFGADPVFRQTYERSIKNIAIGGKNVVDIVKPITDLGGDISKKLLKTDDAGRLFRKSLDELGGILKPKEFGVVKKAFNKLDDLGREAVNLGIIEKGAFEKNLGKYIKNSYLEYEKAGLKTISKYAKKSGSKGITKTGKARKAVENISEFNLTQVDNPAYLLFKSMVDLTKDVENAKLLRAVNKSFGTDIAQEGFSQISTSKRWGDLAGKYIPDNMKEYIFINEI